MKHLIVFFLVSCNFHLCYSQNPSYKLFEDTIFPIADTDYYSSKEIFLKNIKKCNYDPSEKLLYLTYSLKNEDTKFFKHQITSLIKDYGYFYTYSDTFGISMTDVINQEIYDHGLTHWMVKKTKKHFPRWLAKNPEYIKVMRMLEKLHSSDQLIRSLRMSINDSTCFSSWKNSYDSILAYIDLNNIILIQSACISNGHKILTNFDNGYSTFNQIMFIIFHNLKQGTNVEETWQRLSPYLENAYLEGKISAYFFYAYDYYLNFYFGIQYYGTLGNEIPIKNPEGFEERSKKFKL